MRSVAGSSARMALIFRSSDARLSSSGMRYLAFLLHSKTRCSELIASIPQRAVFSRECQRPTRRSGSAAQQTPTPG
jgi:hypothetical protein